MSTQAVKLLRERQLGGILTDLLPSPTSNSNDSILSTSSISSAHSIPTTSSSTSISTTSSSSTSISAISSISALKTVAKQTLTLTTSAGGQTSFGDATSSPIPISFLQNKVLSKVVFALGIITVVSVITAIIICVIKRRRTTRKLEKYVNFDIGSVGSLTSNHRTKY